MPYNLPHRITNQKDLEYYEKFLKKDAENSDMLKKNQTFYSFLSQNTGKNIRIETTGGYKIGKLKELGDDFLILAVKNTMNQIIIPLGKILSVTLLRGN